jgi:predicted branched-subunit amino acid permease
MGKLNPRPDIAAQPRFSDYATLAFTYFAVGVTVSVAMIDAGVSVPTTLGAALVVYSATSELAFLAVKGAGGSAVVGVLSGWLVASRFGLLAVSLGARYRGGTMERTAAAINSFDPNVGLAVQQPQPAPLRAVFWKVTAALMVGWWAGSLVGVYLGDIVGDGRAWGLDAVFPAALVAIIGSLVRRRDGLTAALAGAGICCVLIPIVPGGLPILASALGAVIALATTGVVPAGREGPS